MKLKNWGHSCNLYHDDIIIFVGGPGARIYFDNQTVLELARKGRDDLFWLCKNVLGYDRVRQKPHQELITWINRSKKRTKLILMPRGSFKSSVITIGHTIQKIIQNPNIRILG